MGTLGTALRRLAGGAKALVELGCDGWGGGRGARGSVGGRMGDGGKGLRLGLQVVEQPDVWRCIADKLPLLSRAMCCRVSRGLKRVVEGDGLDYGVATLCCVLSRDRPDALMERLFPHEEEEEEGAEGGLERRMREVRKFIGKLGCVEFLPDSQGQEAQPESWVKMAMLNERDGGWLFEGAKRTRIDYDLERCELGWTRLHLAIVRGDDEGMRELEEGGLDCNLDREAATQDGTRPLHVAALKGRIECMRKLLGEGGVETEARGGYCQFLDMTPLHMACRRGQVECMRELLERGADREAKTDEGLRPMH